MIEITKYFKFVRSNPLEVKTFKFLSYPILAPTLPYSIGFIGSMESSELHTHRDTGGCCIRGNLATRYPSTRHPGPIFETLEELKTREAEEWSFCQNRDFDDLVYESYRPTRPRLPSQRGIHGI